MYNSYSYDSSAHGQLIGIDGIPMYVSHVWYYVYVSVWGIVVWGSVVDYYAVAYM